MAATSSTGVLEFDLLLRVCERDRITPALAHELLKLKFLDSDEQRMHELAEKNQDGTISVDEQKELDAHVRVGMLVSILQSRARQVLQKAERASEKVGVRPARG